MNNCDPRDELKTAQHKTKVKALQEQIRVLEDITSTENSDRDKTLKELKAERGTTLNSSHFVFTFCLCFL